MSTSMMERFVKKSYLVHLLAKVQKKKKEKEPNPQIIPYISRKELSCSDI